MSELQSGVHQLKIQFPRIGQVEWIGLRPGRGMPMDIVDLAEISLDDGMVGDRFSGPAGAKRQVTLIQAEDLDVIARLLELDSVSPAQLRRNIVVSGINLTALKGVEFQIGSAVLMGTGACAPCSKMEVQLGPGGFNAMRGRGGIVASVVKPGTVSVGDPVRFSKLASPN